VQAEDMQRFFKASDLQKKRTQKIAARAVDENKKDNFCSLLGGKRKKLNYLVNCNDFIASHLQVIRSNYIFISSPWKNFSWLCSSTRQHDNH
jgi:hypothetical protein